MCGWDETTEQIYVEKNEKQKMGVMKETQHSIDMELHCIVAQTYECMQKFTRWARARMRARARSSTIENETPSNVLITISSGTDLMVANAIYYCKMRLFSTGRCHSRNRINEIE